MKTIIKHRANKIEFTQQLIRKYFLFQNQANVITLIFLNIYQNFGQFRNIFINHLKYFIQNKNIFINTV